MKNQKYENFNFFTNPFPTLEEIIKDKSFDKVYLRVLLLDNYTDILNKCNSSANKDKSLLTYLKTLITHLENESKFWGLFAVNNGEIISLDSGTYSDKNSVVVISEFEGKNEHCATIIVPAVEENNLYVRKVWRVL